MSGPLLDRIDLHIEVRRLEYREIETQQGAEPSGVVRHRVTEARERQRRRLAPWGLSCNAEMSGYQVRECCSLTRGARLLLRSAFNKLALSMRGHDRLLKVARTIADLEGAEMIEEHHLAEALQYRSVWGG